MTNFKHDPRHKFCKTCGTVLLKFQALWRCRHFTCPAFDVDLYESPSSRKLVPAPKEAA